MLLIKKTIRLLLLIICCGCQNEEIISPKEEITSPTMDGTDVLISEILPDPKKEGVEFIEIFNNSTKVVDLSLLQVASVNSTGKRSKLHPISQSSLYIYPLSYKLLSLNSEIVAAQYPIQDKSALLTMPSFPVLTNSEGAVMLLKNEEVIDSLAYHAKMHDIFIKDTKGVSLERSSFNIPTNSKGNFISAAASTAYATPGYQNSQLSNEEPISQPITLNSEIFSPSKKEQLEINFNFNKGGKMVNLTIFNASGKAIRHLLKSHRLGTLDRILWNGESDLKRSLPTGVYFLHFEIYDSKGTLDTYRRTCILV